MGRAFFRPTWPAGPPPPATSEAPGRHLAMSYTAALAFFAHARADDATDVIRILCAMATAADLVGNLGSRDRTI